MSQEFFYLDLALVRKELLTTDHWSEVKIIV